MTRSRSLYHYIRSDTLKKSLTCGIRGGRRETIVGDCVSSFRRRQELLLLCRLKLIVYTYNWLLGWAGPSKGRAYIDGG